jgi:CHAT domain-containing protein
MLFECRRIAVHMGDGLAPPTALRRAQTWLRQASNIDLVSYAKVAKSQGRLQIRHLAEIEKALSVVGLKRSRNRALVQWIARDGKPKAHDANGDDTAAPATRMVPTPYAHPYYWAGFGAVGLRPTRAVRLRRPISSPPWVVRTTPAAAGPHVIMAVC